MRFECADDNRRGPKVAQYSIISERVRADSRSEHAVPNASSFCDKKCVRDKRFETSKSVLVFRQGTDKVSVLSIRLE